MSLPSKSASLSEAFSGAASALALVETGMALPRALAQVFESHHASPQTRGAIQDLAYRSMRNWGAAQQCLAALMPQPPQQARLKTLLCCALSLLSDPTPIYAPHTIVDQAVTAASQDQELAKAKGLVNAVLRRFLRERDQLLTDLSQHLSSRWNYPDWWIQKMQRDWPHDWEHILTAGNQPPPLTLRVNRRKVTTEAYLQLLQEQAMQATIVGPYAIRLQQALPVTRIPSFLDGLVSVQDAAAQLAAPLCDIADGMHVLDACAAPGGKTGHLLECADIQLLALDHDAKRLQRIKENLTRLQLQAKLITGDASNQLWWDGQLFDRILADVPCTASGIVRRHPDIRWLRRPEDSRQLARLAARILDNLWQMLKPEGKLLFVTCSLWPEESTLQAQSFEQKHGAIRLPAPGQMLPMAQAEQDQDGLFYALFQKPSV
ncbi:MAG: 16S rRNA (cytosine(967)-C(5))-methyltransferase RsmB [Burkholderiales bacterium]|nr:16S rRNA (cytosine(967)-C(5))-methyltransferase RsmB [Burkholderiales bacterium]